MTSKTACASSSVLVDVATGYKKNLILALEREFECPASSKEKNLQQQPEGVAREHAPC